MKTMEEQPTKGKRLRSRKGGIKKKGEEKIGEIEEEGRGEVERSARGRRKSPPPQAEITGDFWSSTEVRARERARSCGFVC